MAGGGKISTDGSGGLGQNPFGALSGAGLPSAPKVVNNEPTAMDGAAAPPPRTAPDAAGAPHLHQPVVAPAKNRGRVDVRRETGNRGGKTVTVIDGFIGIGLSEKEQLAKKMRAACGCGGTVKDGQIEIQGDQRTTVARILTEAGFRPVMAGG